MVGLVLLLAGCAAAADASEGTDMGVLYCDVEAAMAASSITVDGTRFALQRAGEPVVAEEETPLGRAVTTSYPTSAEGMPVQVVLKVSRYADATPPMLRAAVTNASAQTCRIDDLEMISVAPVAFGDSPRDGRAYIEPDPGHPRMMRLLTEADGTQTPLKADSQGVAVVATPAGKAFTAGFVTAPSHRPVVRVVYAPDEDVVRVTGIARFNGRPLDAGERVETGLLALQGGTDALAALEGYGDLLARALGPRRVPATMGWCSWYAIRLPISHEFTMANARVMAQHFRGLGMDLMLLDHGWQEGDICGDWDVDPKDYPTGLEGLSKDLAGLGMKLGIWIAPTDVAETSKLFQSHPDWMLKNSAGEPAVTWQWYWEPKPNEYGLDATQPDAYRYLVDTFKRLTQAGSQYYKIDFIAAVGREDLYPADPKAVRGWDPLRRAMEAIREGAGEQTYVRYCQTPPLLSAGLAEGVYATNDTLDAGTSTWQYLHDAFRMSAAEYWYQGRLYNHDACDLSVRSQGGTEECRLRAMMLALSGSSIMFSDDMTQLPEERIRLMQQCLPALPQTARPLNLFTSDEPDVWHLHVEHAGLSWEVVGLFNFTNEQREFNVAWSQLGLPDDTACVIREFWTGAFEGPKTGQASFSVPGLAARLYAFWPVADHPQYVGTDLHVAQGLAELEELQWDAGQNRLAGRLKRAPGIHGQVYVYLPEGWQVAQASATPWPLSPRLCAIPVTFESTETAWDVTFEKR